MAASSLVLMLTLFRTHSLKLNFLTTRDRVCQTHEPDNTSKHAYDESSLQGQSHVLSHQNMQFFHQKWKKWPHGKLKIATLETTQNDGALYPTESPPILVEPKADTATPVRKTRNCHCLAHARAKTLQSIVLLRVGCVIVHDACRVRRHLLDPLCFCRAVLSS